MTTKPLPFQLEDIKKIESFNGRALIAWEMGLGKSFGSLLYAHRNKDLRPIIIVCPASLKWNWANECATHFNLHSEILEGMKPPRKGIGRKSKGIYIINYDILGAWLQFLKELSPQLVILDEAHYCKSLKARRTKYTRMLCNGVEHVLALSGTPLTNRPAELYSILNLLRPDLYNSAFTFYSNYCRLQRTPWGWKYDGARNLKELHQKLTKTVMIRRRKKDVLSELPDKQRHIITLPIEDEKEYKEAVTDFLGWLKGKDASKVKKAAKAEQITKMVYLSQLAANKKLPAMFDWIDNYLEETNDKLLFFAVHRSIIKALHSRYDKISVVVTGKVKGRKRQQAFDQFNKDTHTRILFGNIQAAGVGWNCKATHNTAVGELPWTPGELTQLEDRTHGIKRGVEGKKSNYYYLLGKDTIEIPKCRLLQRKARILDNTLDGRRQVDSLDIYDLLAKELKEDSRVLSS